MENLPTLVNDLLASGSGGLSPQTSNFRPRAMPENAPQENFVLSLNISANVHTDHYEVKFLFSVRQICTITSNRRKVSPGADYKLLVRVEKCQ